MATLDSSQGTVVVRVVYDGPPFSGKTTSLQALAGTLADRRRSALFSPAESAGRTLYFDWLDYTGGLMAGHQVRCQIVSVPGQLRLVERRAFLVRSADVVVFVADSSREGIDASAASFQSLAPWLERPGGPPVGVVVQVNKADAPNALSTAEVRDRLGAAPHVAFLESVATEGRGVREAFVFSIRLALDRVRAMMQNGSLPAGPPDVENGQELLARMTAEESRTSTLVEELINLSASHREQQSALKRDTGGPAAAGDPASPPPLPGVSIPSGLVWPPVTGRVVLLGIQGSEESLSRAVNGDYQTSIAGWRVLSRAGDEFDSLEDGRRALIKAARLHAQLKELLSEHRAVALAESGRGSWRLWSLVRQETALRSAVVTALTSLATPQAARRLVALAGRLEQAAERFSHAGARLPLSLDTLSAEGERPCFIDFLPARLEPDRRTVPLPSRERLARLLVPQVMDQVLGVPLDGSAIAEQLLALSQREPSSASWANHLAAKISDPA